MHWTQDRPLLLLSAISPWLVIGLCFWLLSSEADGSDWQVSPEGSALSQRMVERQPRVVILGNSVTQTHIDPDRVAAALDREPVERVHAKASNAITWWLMLKNHVYGAGAEPELLIVPFELDFLLAQQLTGDESARAAPYWGPVELELEQKLMSSGGPRWWQRLKQRRGEHRDWFLETTRDLMVQQFFVEEGEAADGHDLAEHAFEELFSFEHMRGAGERGASAVPIVDVREEIAARRANLFERTVAASLVPELLALTAEHGTRVLFVQIPLPPSNDRSAFDRALRAELVETLNQHDHASFLDLSDLPVTAADFSDKIHLNARGRDRFTTALVEGLEALDVLGDGPLPQVEVEAIARISRLGTPPAMPELTYEATGGCEQRLKLPPELRVLGTRLLWREGIKGTSPLEVLERGEPLLYVPGLGEACSGAYVHESAQLEVNASEPFADAPSLSLRLSEQTPLVQNGGEAWWVYPGTTLLLEFDKPWPEEQLRVLLGAYEAIPGNAAVRFEVDGQQVRVKGEGHLSASYKGGAPQGPLRLSVTSPDNGPWLLLTELEASFGDTTWRPVSTERTLVTEARLLDVATLSFEERLPVIESTVAASDMGWQQRVFDERWAVLADPELRREHDLQYCSPLRVFEGDTVIGEAFVSCGEVKQTARGSCSRGNALMHGSTDGSDPNQNGRDYRVSADPERACTKQGRWLYPGELLRLVLDGNAVKRLPPGGDTLEISAVPFSPDAAAKGRVRVEVRVDGRKVHSERFKAKDLLDSPQIRIPAMARTKGELVVTVKAEKDAPWLLVTSVSVRR